MKVCVRESPQHGHPSDRFCCQASFLVREPVLYQALVLAPILVDTDLGYSGR